MIHLVCALKCEAKPLLRHYQLVHQGNFGTFISYSSRESDLTLTITGPGPGNAAAGTEHAHARFASLRNEAWLNIGIAGHRSIAVGEAVLARQIRDQSSNQVWTPEFNFVPPCRTAELLTLTEPGTGYDNRMVDMEAAGFYASASRYSTPPLIHALKIISDNAMQPANGLSATFVEKLIANRMQTINQLLDKLRFCCTRGENITAIPCDQEPQTDDTGRAG